MHESLHDAFVDGFAARAKALKLGDGLDPAAQMGPLINGDRLRRDRGHHRRRGEGRRARGRRRRPRRSAFNAGFFHEPTVLAEVTDDMRVFAEENFGPIAAITRFRDEDEVLERANAARHGALGLRLHPQPGARAADRRGAEGGHGRHQQLRAGRRRGAVRRDALSPAWGARAAARGIGDYLDTKLAQVVF